MGHQTAVPQMGYATQVEVAHRLAARTPAKMAAEFRSLASSLKIELRRAAEGPTASLTALGSPEALAKMRGVVEKALTPAPEFLIGEWLAEIDAITVAAGADELDKRLQLKALTRRLAGFPADIVKAAILGWQGKFFPSYGELHDRIAADFAARMQLVKALRAATEAPPPEAEPDPEARRMNAERAQAIVEAAGFGRRVPPRMAVTPAQAEADAAPPRPAHWAKTAADDDPRWQAVEDSRAADPVIQAAREAARRAAFDGD